MSEINSFYNGSNYTDDAGRLHTLAEGQLILPIRASRFSHESSNGNGSPQALAQVAIKSALQPHSEQD